MYLSSRRLQQVRRVQGLLDRLQAGSEPTVVRVPGSGSQEPRGTVIIFTGSFNPPTIAHVALLKEVEQYLQSQHVREPVRLYAAFSKRSVDKETVERPLLLDRILLLQSILWRRLPHIGILLFNRGLYVDQARGIRNAFPGVKKISFLMGFDKIVQILDPRYYQKRDDELDALFTQVELMVAPRGEDGEQELKALLGRPENRRYARYIHAIPLSAAYRDISSTHVRKDSAGYAQETLPEVRTFIRETHAYQPVVKQYDGSEVDYYEKRVQALNKALQAKTKTLKSGV